MSAWMSYALRQGQFFKPVLVSSNDEGIECFFTREHRLIVIRVEIASDHNAFDLETAHRGSGYSFTSTALNGSQPQSTTPVWWNPRH